jgi:DNA-binding MarR family transcriptional regulator
MPRFWVLRKLDPEKAITMGDLQRQMLLAPATITGLVDALVQMGLVNRCRNEEDRRLVFLNLTPDGKTLVDEVLKYRASVLKAVLKDQEEIDAELFISYLDKIHKHLDKVSQQSIEEN